MFWLDQAKTVSQPFLTNGKEGGGGHKHIVQSTYANLVSFLLPLYIHEKINSSESVRWTILPEPERFFGGKRVLYLTPSPPSPTPSRRPPWALVRSGLMGWVGTCNDLGPKGCWYTRNTNMYISNAGGPDGIFFFNTSPLLAPLYLDLSAEQRMRH